LIPGWKMIFGIGGPEDDMKVKKALITHWASVRIGKLVVKEEIKTSVNPPWTRRMKCLNWVRGRNTWRCQRFVTALCRGPQCVINVPRVYL
jgi:hypothetical protein